MNSTILKTGNKKRFIDSTGEHTLFENPGNYTSYDKLGLVDGKELGVFSYQFMYDYDDSYMQGNHVYLIDGDNLYESFSFVNNSGILQCKNGKDMSMLYYSFDDYNAYGELVECTSIYVRDKGSYHYSLSEQTFLAYFFSISNVDDSVGHSYFIDEQLLLGLLFYSKTIDSVLFE